MTVGFEQELGSLWIFCGDYREPTGVPQRDFRLFHEPEDLRVELERLVLVVYENARDVDSHLLIPPIPLMFKWASVRRYSPRVAYRDSGTCTDPLVSWSRGRPIRGRRDAGISPVVITPSGASSSTGCTVRRASGRPCSATRPESCVSLAKRGPQIRRSCPYYMQVWT